MAEPEVCGHPLFAEGGGWTCDQAGWHEVKDGVEVHENSGNPILSWTYTLCGAEHDEGYRCVLPADHGGGDCTAGLSVRLAKSRTLHEVRCGRKRHADKEHRGPGGTTWSTS